MNLTRLEELRDELEISKKKIANDLGISDSVYGRWENDRFLIPTRRLYQLGNYFQVNIDYILRLTDVRISIKSEKKIDLNLVSKRLKEIRTDLNCTLRELTNDLHTSSSTWSAYETGKVLVLSAFLIQICQKENFSIDWILGRSDEKYRK